MYRASRSLSYAIRNSRGPRASVWPISQSKRAMDPDALFGVASISKTFTAAAIVQLRDDGKLSLDDPLAKFIPEFKAVTCRYGRIEDVTLRRLLTHLSGLVGESPTPHWRSANFPTMEDILRGLPNSALVIEPHSAFKYSNLGFALLGEVVARVSGRPFTEYLRSEVLDPFGMKSSCFTLEEAGSKMATGYLPHPYDDVPEAAPVATDHQGYAAAAGLRSSVNDLAKWISLQFRTKAKQARRRAGSRRPVAVGDASGGIRRARLAHRLLSIVVGDSDWRKHLSQPWRLESRLPFVVGI